MIDELKKYIEELFASAPKTRAAYELKEELLANSTERYFDLVEDKIPEKEAFDIVIHSIGDIDQLFAQEEVKTVHQTVDDDRIKKSALIKSIAIGLYILSFCMMVAIEELTMHGDMGFVLMMAMIAVATSMLVYAGIAYPKYKKVDDTVVEEFKEWNSKQKNIKSIKSSINTIIWMITLVIYFLISFTSGAWHITWIMFLIGVCAQSIVNLLFQLKDKS